MDPKHFCCCDCGAPAPTTSDEVTRASSLGWRLVLKPAPNGKQDIEWRCPRCWVAYKVKDGSGAISVKKLP